jgi:hypothetical protein
LKSLDDATDIRRNLLIAFERAKMAGDAAARTRLLTFVLVGAGPTGVELAGARWWSLPAPRCRGISGTSIPAKPASRS